MIRLRWPRLAWGVAVLGATAVYLSPSFGLTSPHRLRNTGDSMPLGDYVLERGVPVERGAVVAVRYPEHFHLWWLLKRVEGVAGDVYCWRSDLGTHTLSGRAMPRPLPEAVAMGIPVWKGCRTLGAGEIVGYGQSATSYDSRYFGPISTDRLWGVYKLVD